MKSNSDVSINPGTLLILGNGFDIDLGYKTSYCDFYEPGHKSDLYYFPFVKGGNDFYNLGNYILKQACLEKWFDLEDVLGKYGESRRGASKHDLIEKDKSDFCKLRIGLIKYLNALDYRNPRKDALGVRLFTLLANGITVPKVYSFNYTDLSKNLEFLNISIGDPVYVHGSLKNNDIILGVGDYVQLDENCDFMYKSNFDSNSSGLLRDLEDYQNIIIYGHSLSAVDYPYFDEFFTKLANGELDSKSIWIITKNDDSKQSILRNLRSMNSGIQRIKNHAELRFIRTEKEMDVEKEILLFERIENTWQFNKECV